VGYEEALSSPAWSSWYEVVRAEGVAAKTLSTSRILGRTWTVPLEVGRMVLNHKPENYFAEVAQSAFCSIEPK